MNIVSPKKKKPTPFYWYKKAVFDDYLNFRGRACTKEFWWFSFFHWMIVAITIFIAVKINDYRGGYEGFYLTASYMTLTIIPHLAVQARRLHDLDCSGWAQLIIFILYYYMGVLVPLVLLVINFLPSQFGENKYGTPPE